MMDVAFWYHFAILFEALFILDGGRCGYACCALYVAGSAGRGVSPALKRTDSLPANLLATALCVLAWGYFLHQGVVDPLGGINTLWPLFGIANQMLAGDGADALCRGVVQDETSTLRPGGAGTNGPAADLYP
ncbi:carbon starvation CstA family protein [Escherichia coli]